ncbi:hypothetical protein ACFQO7_27200 [Catellatospora aurea]|uniref:Uncharacterized protein n=1 Tax=Catellatospora aurea TaxID=1337874 RepID=A0ABW2H793_9ACTN
MTPLPSLARFYRRHLRVSGTVSTLLLVAGLTTAALLPAPPAARPALDMTRASAWLESTAIGAVSLVSATAGRVVTVTAVPGAAGHRMSVQQDGPDPYVSDLDANTITRIDGARLAADPAVAYPAPVDLVTAGGDLYAVSMTAGSVTAVDPVTLTETGVPLGLPHPPLGAVLAGPDGILWAHMTLNGTLVGVRDGAVRTSAPSAFFAEQVALAEVDGTVVLANLAKGIVVALDERGVPAQRWAALPATGPTALVAARGADGVLPVVLPGRGELVLSRPGRAPADIVDLRAGSAARLGRPVLAGGVVYVPDDATGRVLRYAPGRGLLAPLWVTAGQASLRVIARDGLVWAHDADGPQAVVVDGDTVRSLLKYTVPSPSAVPSAAPPSAAAPPSPGPSPMPRRDPVLRLPITYRAVSITSFTQLQGQAAWVPAIRNRLLSGTWRLTKSGSISYTAQGMAANMQPVGGTFSVSGSRVGFRGTKTYRDSVANNSLTMSGTITAGPRPVMTVTFDSRTETVAIVNGQTFRTVVVSRYRATLRLTA